MAKYVIAYHGGSKPESKEAGMKLMTDWQNWVNNMGTALIDPGNGVGMSKTVMNDGTVVDNGGVQPHLRLFSYQRRQYGRSAGQIKKPSVSRASWR